MGIKGNTHTRKIKNTSTHEGVQKKVCQIFQGISALLEK